MKKHELQNLRLNRSRLVVKKIREWISQGIYGPGERLPAERKLATDLQVSRTSIREAFLILEENDCLEIRRGVKGGAYVKTPAIHALSADKDIVLRIGSLSLDQIAEFREAIEVSVASMAARQADSTDLVHLNHLVETARSYVDRGSGCVDLFIQADKAVHICIAQISKNPLIANALEAVLALDHYFDRFHMLEHALMEDNFQDLRNLVDAIGNHQPEIASRLCQSHIRRFNKLAG